MLPDNYVTGSSERMSLYSELDELVLDDEVEVFEKTARSFGPIPEETSELLKIVLYVVWLKTRYRTHIFEGGQMILFLITMRVHSIRVKPLVK